MEERERIAQWNEKEDLIDEVKALFGVEPQGFRQTLMALVHPEIIQHAIKYFKSLDDAHVCIKYEAPWNCARAAQANYESLAPDWAGEGTVVISGDWCQPCRRRAMGEEASDKLLFSNEHRTDAITENWLEESEPEEPADPED